MKALIVTCDDCGLSQGINAAALALYQQGMAHHASVMANGAAAQHALDLFAPYPSFKLGVHLNLTEGAPLTSVAALSPLTDAAGHFHSPRHLLRQTLFPGATLRVIERELTAQVEFFLQRGIQPQHVTTHLHFHLLPALRALVERLVERYHIPWLRPHRLRAVVMPFNPLLHVQHPLPTGLAADVPSYLAVVQHWVRYPPTRLVSALDRLASTVELVVHPDLATDESLPPDMRYSAPQRFAETRYLERLWTLLPPALAARDR